LFPLCFHAHKRTPAAELSHVGGCYVLKLERLVAHLEKPDEWIGPADPPIIPCRRPFRPWRRQSALGIYAAFGEVICRSQRVSISQYGPTQQPLMFDPRANSAQRFQRWLPLGAITRRSPRGGQRRAVLRNAFSVQWDGSASSFCTMSSSDGVFRAPKADSIAAIKSQT
jgi:hypothetical protein